MHQKMPQITFAVVRQVLSCQPARLSSLDYLGYLCVIWLSSDEDVTFDVDTSYDCRPVESRSGLLWVFRLVG